jgi:undecaprenyl-diphosphatase
VWLSRLRSGDPGDRRRALFAAAIALVLFLGVGALIGKAADYAELLDALERANGAWFALCLVGEAAAYLGYISAYGDVARVDGGPVIDFWQRARIVALGFGATVLSSAPGGLAVDYWALRRAGLTPHDAIARVLALNTLQWVSLPTAACAAAVALLLTDEVPLELALPWLVIVPTSMLIAAWVSSPKRCERLGRRPEGDGLRVTIRRLFADSVRGLILVRKMLRRPHRYPLGVLGFPLYWAGEMACLYAGLQAFGADVPVAGLVLGYATGKVATALPLPAGGAGGVDAAMTYSLVLIGVPLAPALLGVFAYRLFSFWLPLVPALAVVPNLRTLREELEAEPRSVPASP